MAYRLPVDVGHHINVVSMLGGGAHKCQMNPVLFAFLNKIQKGFDSLETVGIYFQAGIPTADSRPVEHFSSDVRFFLPKHMSEAFKNV